MSDKELTKEESLKLITDMISQAKRNFAQGGSFYFLLWGWVVMLANLGHYILSIYEYDQPYIVWILTMPAGIISGIHGSRSSRNGRVKSHLDKAYGLVWVAMLISVLIILFHMPSLPFNINPIILAFAAAGTFISGSLLRFKPLIWGAVALWITSIIGFNLPMNEQYLVGAVGIFAGYLIPGYLLKKAENA